MQIECINDNWYMDIETGKTGLSFKCGQLYDTVEASEGIESKGDTIVINEQGRRHIVKTEIGLSRFFNSYFRFI